MILLAKNFAALQRYRMTDDIKFYTAEEIAKILKVSKQWIYNLSNSKLNITKRLPYKKFGRLKRFNIEDVLTYFEDHSDD